MDIEAKLQELIEVAEEWNWQQSGILKTEIIQYVKALEAQLTPAQLHLAESEQWVAATDKTDRKASITIRASGDNNFEDTVVLYPFMAEPPQFNDRYLIEPCTHCKEWSYKDGLVKGLCRACHEQLGTPPDEQ